jgi:plasmid stability protein
MGIAMKTLTIREVPDDVYAAIVREAQVGQRSIQEQVRFVLAKEARLRQGGFLDAARQWRQRVAGRELGDTLGELREGRERR